MGYDWSVDQLWQFATRNLKDWDIDEPEISLYIAEGAELEARQRIAQGHHPRPVAEMKLLLNQLEYQVIILKGVQLYDYCGSEEDRRWVVGQEARGRTA